MLSVLQSRYEQIWISVRRKERSGKVWPERVPFELTPEEWVGQQAEKGRVRELPRGRNSRYKGTRRRAEGQVVSIAGVQEVCEEMAGRRLGRWSSSRALRASCAARRGVLNLAYKKWAVLEGKVLRWHVGIWVRRERMAWGGRRLQAERPALYSRKRW